MTRTMQLLVASLALVWIHAFSLVEAGRQRYAVLAAGDEPMLQGTWSSGSGRVVTGAGFFNPRTRSFTPPAVPGQAYSFTGDGYWEFAKYRVTPNRKCPFKAVRLLCKPFANALPHVRFSFQQQGNPNASKAS